MNGYEVKVMAFLLVGFSAMAAMKTTRAAEPPHDPPPPKPAIGQEEWTRTGDYPTTLVLRVNNTNNSAAHGRLLFSNPIIPEHVSPPHHVTFGINRPLAMSGKTDGWQERPPVLWINDSPHVPRDSSLFDGAYGTSYDLVQGDVFPFHDQLILVKELALEKVTLELVKDRVPKALRPANVSRCLPLNLHQDRGAPFKYEFFIPTNPRWVFGEIRVDKIDPQKLQADVTVIPPKIAEGHQPLKLTVAKDALLRPQTISYRVLNIVPPQDIKDVGRLVGWIEIAPYPEEAKKLPGP